MSLFSARGLVPFVFFATACAPEVPPPQVPEAPPPHVPEALSLVAPPEAPPPAHPEALPPPAKPKVVVDERGCVRSPADHAVEYILSHHASEVAERLGRAPVASDFDTASCLSTTSLPDVDGDGADETVVTEGCSWGQVAGLHLLYRSNLGCPLLTGEFVSGTLTRGEGKGGAPRDLETSTSNGCAGNDFVWARYRWNGKAYAVTDRATCQLCTDDGAPKRPRGANTHPHCRAAAKSLSR